MSGDYPLGPWEAEHGADGFYLVTYDGGIPLEDNTDAVERLIGAAPELLEALEASQKILSTLLPNWSDETKAQIKANAAALAKATAA